MKPGKKHTTKHSSPRKETKEDAQEDTVRLNKFIADAGICSRREADKLIAAGDIKINGEIVTVLGTRVSQKDEIKYKGKSLRRERFIYLLLNKPKNCITTTNDELGRKTAHELVQSACKERIYPVGRLDRNTTGLLLFTNDGELTKRLTHPKYEVTKKYLAEFDSGIPSEQIELLQKGVELEDGFSKFDKVAYEDGGHNQKKVLVEIHSGKNRIVRRMFEHVGYEVKKLDRINFAGLKKGSLTRGKWRALTPREIGFLKMVK